MEVILLIPYLMTWIIMQLLTMAGTIFPFCRSLAMALREFWTSWMSTFTAYGKLQYAQYQLFKSVNLQQMICDKIMYKYWIFHLMNIILVPEMNPFAVLQLFGFDMVSLPETDIFTEITPVHIKG